ISTDLDETGSARCADVAARVMEQYRRRLAAMSDGGKTPRAEARQSERMELQMRIAAVRAERSMLYKMRGDHKLSDETLTKLLREIDLSETALSTRKKGLV
ncbi:Na+/H+ antiporter, partial [Paraburkholderia sp. Se-20369]|nr:Na+/H+ antiporter [Paraburkholderia sp. Se-20369]